MPTIETAAGLAYRDETDSAIDRTTNAIPRLNRNRLGQGRQTRARPKARRLKEQAASVSPPPGPLDQGRLDSLILARILAEPRGIERADIARDLAPLTAPWLQPDVWRLRLDQALMTLSDAGLISYRGTLTAMTDAGRMRAGLLLGAKGVAPKTWAAMKATRLMALALGGSEMTGAKQQALAKPDGLRAGILEAAYKLKLRGAASPTRVRTALAAVALAQAFGAKQGAANGGGKHEKPGLAPRAGRALAGQLLLEPRDPKTDGRLLADLAAEVMEARSQGMPALQAALLQRYLAGLGAPVPQPRSEAAAAAKPSRAKRVRATARRQNPATVATVVPPQALVRPSFDGFAAGVLTAARALAQGWAGSRKAYISQVFDAVAADHPQWGLTGVEFKAMLTEAHRLGRIILATIDLRSDANLALVQASQVTFKNTNFHLIRVDG